MMRNLILGDFRPILGIIGIDYNPVFLYLVLAPPAVNCTLWKILS